MCIVNEKHMDVILLMLLIMEVFWYYLIELKNILELKEE
jgi:hypothetical protein